MFGIHNFLLFVASGLLLNITPGADMLYVMSSSVARGVRAGVLAALSIFSGTLFHIGFAMIGLSALLATSAAAFTIIKYVGAAYLIYLGARLLLEKKNNARTTTPRAEHRSLLHIYRQGVLINLLNPKIALFFLAFLPQFIASDSPHRTLDFLILGLTFNITGTSVNCIAAWSAHSVGRRVGGSGRLAYWLKKTVGGVFVGLGLKLAASGRG
ncbi:MAG: LysE family translocator [Salinisphaera sp.]|nr:LysE family translocator [Salinisphaera sp.]